MPALKVGDRSDEVVELKRLLARQGYWRSDHLSPNFTPGLEAAVVYFQQTHLNQRGKPCGVDGKVGPETWWALRHPSGQPQRSHLAPGRIPTGIGDERTRLLEIALTEHGVREIPDGSNRSDKPRGGVDKYLPAWGKQAGKAGPPWCCFFVSWVTKQAFDHYPLGRREGACRNAHALAKDLGMWRPKSSYTPVPGDAFVMLYKKKGVFTGKGHIGFVLRVSRNAEEFNTLEGNCGNRVKLGKRQVAHASIVGYIDFWKNGRLRQEFSRGLVAAANVANSGTR